MNEPFRWSDGSTNSSALRVITYAGLLLAVVRRHPVRAVLAAATATAALAGLHRLGLLGLLPLVAAGLIVARAGTLLDDALDCAAQDAGRLRDRAGLLIVSALLLAVAGCVWLARAA